MKYGNHPIRLDGILFASKKEGYYYLCLKDLQAQGIIRDLCLQKRIEILPRFPYKKPEKRTEKKYKTSTIGAVHYIPDFTFTTVRPFSLTAGIYTIPLDAEEYVVVDVKGMKTSTYQLKRKLFLHTFPDVVFIEA